MKTKIIFFILFAVFFVSKIYSQNVFPLQLGMKWGLFESTLKNVTPIKFDGIYRVENSQKSAFIAVECFCKKIFYFDGKEASSQLFDSVNSFKNLILTWKNKKCGIFDVNKQVEIFSPQYFDYKRVNDSIFFFYSKKETKFNTQGFLWNLASQKKSRRIDSIFGIFELKNTNLDKIYILDSLRKTYKAGIINVMGNFLIPLIYKTIQFDTATKKFIVQNFDKSFGVINDSSKIIIPFLFENIFTLEKHYIAKLKEKKYFLFNEKAENINELIFNRIKDSSILKNGFDTIFVKQDGWFKRWCITYNDKVEFLNSFYELVYTKKISQNDSVRNNNSVLNQNVSQNNSVRNNDKILEEVFNNTKIVNDSTYIVALEKFNLYGIKNQNDSFFGAANL